LDYCLEVCWEELELLQEEMPGLLLGKGRGLLLGGPRGEALGLLLQ
jgi:hypothetical protein